MTAGSGPSVSPRPYQRRAREKPITPRQREVLVFLARQEDLHGLASTIREVGAAVRITSTSVVRYHLEKLAARGMVLRPDFVSRGIRITPQGRAEIGEPGPDAARDALVGAVGEAIESGAELPANVVAAFEAVA